MVRGVKKRVARGAKFLDTECPGWEREVPLDRMTTGGKGNLNALSQMVRRGYLYGDGRGTGDWYAYALLALGKGHWWGARRGFELTRRERICYYWTIGRNQFTVLDAAWMYETYKRRKAETDE